MDRDPINVEIVLVDDNAADMELAERALRQHGVANRIIWLRNGAEALDFVFCRGRYAGRGNRRPALVLLDLNLPKVGGLEVLRQTKADERTRSIPVIMLSSSAEECDIAESNRLGANGYLVKPMDFSLFNKVAATAGFRWLLVDRT
jgi:CheY-like chemotaxis protein